jgi:predicted Zn-dependent protease with MMP-like domain
MNRDERDRFDALLDEVVESLPRRIHELLDVAPVIVDDRPSAELLAELGMTDSDELLCGLHSGTALTERSVSDVPDLPETIHLFREGIIEHAGGWDEWEDDHGEVHGGERAILREIRVTLLHEIGHHFGLDEDDLEELGYA